MSRSTQAISVGWLDLSEEDRRRAKDYLSQFNAENTLDELGFGILRDAFADLFFPATSTIMTRARYLVFIPALCLVVEREKLSGRAAEQRLTELENELRKSLQHEELRDVIGARAKEKLSRYPSTVYWSSLRRLGIFLHPNWGLAYYQSHLAAFHSSMTAEKDDDGLSHLVSSERRNWDESFCDLLADGHSIVIEKGKLAGSLNFTLTRREARYLQTRFHALAQQQARPSIISHLLKDLHPDWFNYPWDAPYPASLKTYVHHARCFSMLVRGATLQYFHLLQRERDNRGIAQSVFDLSDIFARWWKVTHRELAEWDVEEFVLVVTGLKALRRLNDATFIRSWLKLSTEAKAAKGLLENREAHELIRLRERITRPSKSRLHHFEYLERWRLPDDIASLADEPDKLPFGLDYRAWIGSRFVRDIVSGLAS